MKQLTMQKRHVVQFYFVILIITGKNVSLPQGESLDCISFRLVICRSILCDHMHIDINPYCIFGITHAMHGNALGILCILRGFSQLSLK